MKGQCLSLMEYYIAVDEIMFEAFGIDTGDAAIEIDELACARDVRITPEDFVLTYGEKYGLTPLNEFRANWGRS